MFGLELKLGIRFVEEMDYKPIDLFVSIYVMHVFSPKTLVTNFLIHRLGKMTPT